jgi:hypothetical protein
MANPNISAGEMRALMEMIINTPVGSYVNALTKQPLVNKFVEAHNQVVTGCRLDVLNAAEAAAVDMVRRNAAQPAQPAQPAKPAAPGKTADMRGGKVFGPQC